jgi:hypothetical protein
MLDIFSAFRYTVQQRRNATTAATQYQARFDNKHNQFSFTEGKF